MDSRRNSRNIPPVYDERNRQESRMNRHSTLPNTRYPAESHHPAKLFEDKLASQETEVEQLTRDNRKLAAGQFALSQDLAAATGEVDKLREHMRSIQTEGDIQIHILLEKIANRETDIRNADHIKRELQEAHIEERSVMKTKLELSVKIEQATEELEYIGTNIKKLSEMRAKRDSLKQEYQRLCKTFEYEKGLNTEKVNQMKILENDMIGLAGEVDRLRTAVSNAEKRAIGPVAPYGGPNIDRTNFNQPSFHENAGTFGGSFDGHYLHTVHGAPMQIMNPYASGGYAAGPLGVSGTVGGSNGGFAVDPQQVINVPVSGGGGSSGGVYDTSHTQV